MKNIRTDKAAVWGLVIRNPVMFMGYMLCASAFLFLSLHNLNLFQEGILEHAFNLTPVFIGFGVGLILGSRSRDWRVIVFGGIIVAVVFYCFVNIYMG